LARKEANPQRTGALPGTLTGNRNRNREPGTGNPEPEPGTGNRNRNREPEPGTRKRTGIGTNRNRNRNGTEPDRNGKERNGTEPNRKGTERNGTDGTGRNGTKGTGTDGTEPGTGTGTRIRKRKGNRKPERNAKRETDNGRGNGKLEYGTRNPLGRPITDRQLEERIRINRGRHPNSKGHPEWGRAQTLCALHKVLGGEKRAPNPEKGLVAPKFYPPKVNPFLCCYGGNNKKRVNWAPTRGWARHKSWLRGDN